MSHVESVFILAAGKGERLRPLTLKTPKPLLPFRARPLLWSLLERVADLQPKRVILNAWYLKDQILDFARSARNDFSFEIIVSEENELLGTGGGLKQALKFISGRPFLMMNGDCYWTGDIKAFVKASLLQKSRDTVWWIAPSQGDQTAIGLKNGEVVSIGNLWAKDDSDEQGCFSGIQLWHDLEQTKLPEQGCFIRQYLLEKLRSGATVGAIASGLDSWSDIGTPERYQDLLKLQ